MFPLTTASALPNAQADDLPRPSQRDCHFLHLLPVDIRLIIYRCLLVARNVRQEVSMNSEEYNLNRDSALRGPDYSYDFQPSILRANRQIRAEAMDIFERENTFISIIYGWRVYDCCWNQELGDARVAVLARNAQARTFPAVGMDVNCGSGNSHRVYDDESLAERPMIVFLLEDLPGACTSLQRKVIEYSRDSQTVNIRVTLRRHLGYTASASQHSFPVPGSKLWKCLDPLRNIRGTNFVSIGGLANRSHRIAIRAKMREGPLDARIFMAMIDAQLGQGDQALREDHLVSAIDIYNAVLNAIRAFSVDEHEQIKVITGGRFNKLQVGRALTDTEVRLHGLIAEAHLRMGHYRLARIYVERIYGPLAGYDDRVHKVKFPLQIPEDGALPSVYAEILVVAANISQAHGQYYEELVELDEALRLDPSNGKAFDLMVQWHSRDELRDQHWGPIRDRERRAAKRKYDALVQVVRNRARKGDEARDKSNLEVARKQYVTAYEKGEEIEAKNPYRMRVKIPKDLMLNILSEITTASLELHDYESVLRYAEEMTKVESSFFVLLKRGRGKEMIEYAKEAFYTACYSKAVAYQKQGNTKGAIQEFEIAFLCNSGCAATYYQLKELKRRCPEM